MKGDFSRASFDPRHHFSQVLLQQGRVTLDADPNEQGAILLHLLRTLARDVFGPYAAPAGTPGFGLTLEQRDGKRSLRIGAGRYYVDGVLCECDGSDYLSQPHFIPAPANDQPGSGDPLRSWLESSSNQDDSRFWVYLDVWERHLTAVEMPQLREVALGGPDTCSRRQVIWQVRALELETIRDRLEERIEVLKERAEQTQDEAERERLKQEIERLQQGLDQLDEDYRSACPAPLLLFDRQPPKLAAQLQELPRLDDPCVTDPDSAYRGAENHLYRVEIHRGNDNGNVGATFKWSRDNGSVLTRWIGGGGDKLEVANARDFRERQWVEITDEQDDLLGRPGQLSQISGVEGNTLTLTQAQGRSPNATTKVRRWDHVGAGDIVLVDGAVPVDKPDDGKPGKPGEWYWIALEDGIQVRFAADGEYRSGDYWLIPARVATGNIEWPRNGGVAELRPPLGVEHRYAPLGFVGLNVDGMEGVDTCTCVVYPDRSCGMQERFDDAVSGDNASGTVKAVKRAPQNTAVTVKKTAATKPKRKEK
ncbi:DUF6519 domain-containing protein [Lysobacter antibioticus]|uniref:Uncharacterized protein n=1 Tax=Lysobacter antibioticus TaxID=84531 RepID=A0A0S2FBQ9_LYSAN|nr:DUF6519 domain-containing protein [Lysobacter antibioticus]ALN80960.1 hypothetical protein LA76x_2830 [Lysobacter antibioticus]